MKQLTKKFILILMTFVCLTGCNVRTSHINECSKVEYASETNAKFYQQMVDMERNTQIFFDGFPTCLTSVFYSQPGTQILTTPTDTLYFVKSDLNRSDPNKYPYFVVKDNHGNIWSIFRHNDKYRLIREDERIVGKLLEKEAEKQELD